MKHGRWVLCAASISPLHVTVMLVRGQTGGSVGRRVPGGHKLRDGCLPVDQMRVCLNLTCLDSFYDLDSHARHKEQRLNNPSLL